MIDSASKGNTPLQTAQTSPDSNWILKEDHLVTDLSPINLDKNLSTLTLYKQRIAETSQNIDPFERSPSQAAGSKMIDDVEKEM